MPSVPFFRSGDVKWKSKMGSYCEVEIAVMDTDVALDVKFPKGERPLRRSLTSCSRNLFDVSDI